LLELRNALVGTKPGTSIPLVVRADKKEKTINVVLGNRPELPNYLGDRLSQMERMGGPISNVRDSFTRVIQTDMRPKPNQIGGPVVDLQGRVIGITMARADRTRSFVMPAAAIEELLQKEAQDPKPYHRAACPAVRQARTACASTSARCSDSWTSCARKWRPLNRVAEISAC
jgi:S1-C subfamily serine protease